MKRVIAMAALACFSAGCSQTTETTTQETSSAQTVGAPTTSAASAEVPQVVTHEPPFRLMRVGATVLIDNGKCPAGQLQSLSKPEVRSNRIYRCVDDPRN
ncbi:hypothetical protein NGM99_02160 [Mesorhizobium sp. RP14(2022)]|uniref:Hemolysin n=1 Tax=Mesorhizobium liriopis TaxID=2953882 RepID=A0ABT1C199_9HYPH|nr:DUF6719 family protein [Mesorhizobium liriopis]MCO6048594.1 hypothetical protein [Mesorhizobium liriopis]